MQAILKDKKGFQRGIDIPEFKPHILISVKPDPSVSFAPRETALEPERREDVRFAFIGWIPGAEGKVGVYQES